MDNTGFGHASDQNDMRGQVISSSSTRAEKPKQSLEALQMQSAIRGGASWFYWIAGLSLVNTVASMSGASWKFILGLGVTDIVNAIAAKTGSVAVMASLVINVFIAGVFVLFGVFAGKQQRWAFVTGMVLFALDGALEFLWRDWIGIVFHVYALYRIYSGYKQISELRNFEEFAQAGA